MTLNLPSDSMSFPVSPEVNATKIKAEKRLISSSNEEQQAAWYNAPETVNVRSIGVHSYS